MLTKQVLTLTTQLVTLTIQVLTLTPQVVTLTLQLVTLTPQLVILRTQPVTLTTQVHADDSTWEELCKKELTATEAGKVVKHCSENAIGSTK
jgi:hypothetical protein